MTLYVWKILQLKVNSDIIVASRCQHPKSLGIGSWLVCCTTSHPILLSVPALSFRLDYVIIFGSGGVELLAIYGYSSNPPPPIRLVLATTNNMSYSEQKGIAVLLTIFEKLPTTSLVLKISKGHHNFYPPF